MKKLIIGVFAMAMVVYMTGCASYMSYSASQNEIAKERILASGDVDAANALRAGVPAKQAIHAVKLGNNGVGLAIDITSMDALKKHPWRQLGAGVLDAALMYGAYEGIDALDDDDDKPGNSGSGTSVNLTDSNNNTINIVNGDNNDSNNDDNQASHGGESNLDSNED